MTRREGVKDMKANSSGTVHRGGAAMMTRMIAALAVMTLLAAPVAHADPNSAKAQETYIDSLVMQDFLSQSSADKQRDKLLDLGNAVCTYKANGMDNDEIVPLIRNGAQINSYYANMLIMAAIHYLC
jgi:hypothetical protein